MEKKRKTALEMAKEENAEKNSPGQAAEEVMAIFFLDDGWTG